MILSLLIVCYVAALSSRSMLSMLLFLVTCYIGAALFLASYNLIYSALLYVLVYIGAIVVLFIYVIQLVNTDSSISLYTPQTSKIMLIVNVLLVFVVLIMLSTKINNIDLLLDYSSANFNNNVVMSNTSSVETLSSYNITNLNLLASSLFNDYGYILIIAVHAIVLAVIGPVKLAMHKINNMS